MCSWRWGGSRKGIQGVAMVTALRGRVVASQGDGEAEKANPVFTLSGTPTQPRWLLSRSQSEMQANMISPGRSRCWGGVGTRPEFTASAQGRSGPCSPVSQEGGWSGALRCPGERCVHQRCRHCSEGLPGRMAAWSRGSERSRSAGLPSCAPDLTSPFSPVSWGVTSPLCASVSSSVQWG